MMLYDGANRFLSQAAIAMAERQVEDAHNRLRRAERIIQHLQASLDFEQGGDLAARLASIFVFCQRHLNQARLQADPDKIEQVRGLLGTLRDADGPKSRPHEPGRTRPFPKACEADRARTGDRRPGAMRSCFSRRSLRLALT